MKNNLVSILLRLFRTKSDVKLCLPIVAGSQKFKDNVVLRNDCDKCMIKELDLTTKDSLSDYCFKNLVDYSGNVTENQVHNASNRI